jgi:hypothetical protein
VKRNISATIDEDLFLWLTEQLKDRAKYRNKSHLIEIALLQLKEGRRRN